MTTSQPSLLLLALMAFLVTMPGSGVGHAAITATGGVSPSYNGFSDPWDAGSNLTVGYPSGTLRIDGGSVVQSTHAEVGPGEIFVTDPGSEWISSYIDIGETGSGAVHVENGGLVSSAWIRIGSRDDPTGEVTVTGAGSAMNARDYLYVGSEGKGILNIFDGAVVTSDELGFIGFGPVASGTATVSGTGSALNINEGMSVGVHGTGQLNIENGAEVNVTLDTWLGSEFWGAGSIHMKNGTLSTNGLIASPNNLTGTGVIHTTALLSDIDLVFDSSTGLNHTVSLNTLPGKNITINIDASPTAVLSPSGAGYRGTGSLRIANGLSLFSSTGHIGYYPDSTGTATIEGAGSTWDIRDELYISQDGTGSLTIHSGGTLEVPIAYLGKAVGTTGTATINGLDSVLNVRNELYVGQEGDGKMHITGGGTVNSKEAYVGHWIDSEGVVNISGIGSIWNNSHKLYVGWNGDAIMDIEDGARLNGTLSYIGMTNYSVSTATITGHGSIWDNSSAIYVGNYGTGTMTIEDGGSVMSRYGYLGAEPDSTGTVSVDGPGAVWEVSASLIVGDEGHGAMTITGGGVVHSYFGSISHSRNSTGTVTVDGAGSIWDITGPLNIGGGTYANAHGILNILNGGVVYNTDSNLVGSGGSTAIVTVSGTGSAWHNNGFLLLGKGGDASLQIVDGGVVNSHGSQLANFDNATCHVSISGVGSKWNDTDELEIGSGGSATLNIENGGMLNSNLSNIGVHDNQDNRLSTVTVTGLGSLWNNAGTLYVGKSGTGRLDITNKGAVNVGSDLRMGHFSTGSGTVNLQGGILNLLGSNLMVGDGSSTFNFTGGTLKDAGTINFSLKQNGGTLAPGSSIGQTDIVGEYELNAGSLEIELGGVGNPIDLISVTGDIDIATLGTTLDLRALGPMTAGTYTLMESTGGTITGLFENVDPINLFGVNITVLNTGTAITITLDGDLIFADPNMDGFVGIADLNIVLGNWNQSVTPGDVLAGDLNGDGIVGIEDLNAVLGNWNAGTPPTDTAALVPEPAGAALMFVGVMGAVVRRRCA